MKSNVAPHLGLVVIVLGSMCRLVRASPCAEFAGGMNLLADSASATKNKCGLSQFEDIQYPPRWEVDPTKFYLRETWSVDETLDDPSGYYGSISRQRTDDYGPDCNLLCSSATGTSNGTIGTSSECSSYYDCGGWHRTTETGFFAGCPNLSCWEGTGYGVCGVFGAWEDYETFPVSPTEIQEDPDFWHVGGSAQGTYSRVRSNEYTTAMLIFNTIGALPPYPGTFTGTCSAFRNLSSDETSYTIQRFKYKFTFATAARPFIIRWVERFWPEDGGAPSDTSQSEAISIGATQSNVREVLEPSSDGTVTIEDVCVDPSFDSNAPNACVASPDATPSEANTLGPTVLGKTGTENVDIDITVCSDGANWRAILTGLTGHYSTQARLLPGPPPMQEVTGPNGNTTQQNFCDQAAALYCLAAIDCLGYIPVWYMLRAVQDHEQVHANHMTPALQNAAPGIETLVESQAPNETLNVPDSGQTAQEALDQIRASPGFANAKIAALGAWSFQYASLSANDHNGPCQEAERLVVDPMIAQICDYANTHVWQPLCPVCPYPPPPFAPIANAATNVTSTGFTANWSSAASTAGYRLDVSTTNSFASYVSGYQNLDVGNVTSRSVSGLNRNTNYYYRLRAYNLGGTTGNSNVQNVKTKPH